MNASKRPRKTVPIAPISCEPSRNAPGSENYSAKNTFIGQPDVASSRKSRKHFCTAKIQILEEIIKSTYLRDTLIEDHFKKYGDPYDGVMNEDEFGEALETLGI